MLLKIRISDYKSKSWRDQMLLVLKMQEGAMSQGVQVASKLEKARIIFSPRTSRRNTALPTP